MSVVHRQPDSAARRLTTAETIVVGAQRPRSEAAPGPVPAFNGAHDSPWAVIRIERPGTYRLAADVMVGDGAIGILIAADHVTLDLAGFSVVGKPGSLSGIRVIGARTNVCVRNGSVRSCGGHGVDLADATESHVESLRVTENAGDGVRLGANSTAENVLAWSNSRDGLTAGAGASAERCTARANAGAGISLGDSSQVRGCSAIGNQRQGIQAGIGGVIRDSVARHNHGVGIVVGDLGSIRDCDLIHNEGGEIRAGAQGIVTGNRCLSPAGEGAIAAGPGAMVRENLDGSGARAA